MKLATYSLSNLYEVGFVPGLARVNQKNDNYKKSYFGMTFIGKYYA